MYFKLHSGAIKKHLVPRTENPPSGRTNFQAFSLVVTAPDEKSFVPGSVLTHLLLAF